MLRHRRRTHLPPINSYNRNHDRRTSSSPISVCRSPAKRRRATISSCGGMESIWGRVHPAITHPGLVPRRLGVGPAKAGGSAPTEPQDNWRQPVSHPSPPLLRSVSTLSLSLLPFSPSLSLSSLPPFPTSLRLLLRLRRRQGLALPPQQRRRRRRRRRGRIPRAARRAAPFDPPNRRIPSPAPPPRLGGSSHQGAPRYPPPSFRRVL
ncbi:hypothetical protein DAI22_01g426000 [Oryza sativa Japonica Group]|nr:hypothetical protein DAI22_01g426000 [Oryza sativa Japonica Group]